MYFQDRAAYGQTEPRKMEDDGFPAQTFMPSSGCIIQLPLLGTKYQHFEGKIAYELT